VVKVFLTVTALIQYNIQSTPLITNSDGIAFFGTIFSHLCVFYVENSSDMTNSCYSKLDFAVFLY